MNVIVLTPDRVGSSLLQKILTVTMQGYNYGKPVINLHELTNGLELYSSNKFKQTVLGKPEKEKWGYYQSLEEIVNLLTQADHYKVSRLAQYHLLNRKDSLKDQLSFYKYINDNFYIISARRTNLFEHALSWCIVGFSKSLNVYSHEEKIYIFKNLYRKRITIDQTVLTEYLDKYLGYLEWVKNHFNINSVFNYEQHMPDLENYVDNLDIYPDNTCKKTWQDIYGISWNKWNKMHYLISDMSGFSNQLSYNKTVPLLDAPENKNILLNSMNLIELMSRDSLSLQHQELLKNNMEDYLKVYTTITDMVEDRTLVAGIPIKLQTLAEKAMLVKNFKECVDTFNEWAIKNQKGSILTATQLEQQAIDELKKWYDE